MSSDCEHKAVLVIYTNGTYSKLYGYRCAQCGDTLSVQETIGKKIFRTHLRKSYSELLTDKEKRAEKLAEFIYFGMKRTTGKDFESHPKRVAIAIKDLGYGEDEVCASFLHDVEDFEYLTPILQIINNVFGDRVYGLVLLLSHIPKYIPYNDYIYHIAEISKDAMAIKWQDMIDNIIEYPNERQLDKYKKACIFLQSKGIEIPEIIRDLLKIG